MSGDEHYESEHHHHPNESASNTSDYHEYSYYNYPYDDYDYDYDHFSEGPIQPYVWILAVGVMPVCLLGLAANAVSVRVWNANRKHNTMVLLFQGLGAADNFFLLTTALRALLLWLHVLTPQVEAYIFPLLYLSQCLSIHVTLVIGVFRWLAVARPQRSLKRRHVLATCGGIGAWCVLLTAVVIIRENVVKSHETRHTTMVVVSQVTGFVLPTVLLLVFSLALLRITWRHKRLQSQKKHLKTTTAVLSIACSSFLACPVAVAVHLLAVFTTHNGDYARCSMTCIYVALGVGDLLQVLNSSVNFLFYFFFASKFRPLLQRAICTCMCCPEGYSRRYRQRKASTTSSIQVTSDSGSGTTSSTTHNSCSLGIYRQDSGAEAAVPFREPSTSTATTTTTTTEASATAAERELSARGGGEACREEESSATEATSFV